jgi:PAS domain-containing protein
VAGVIAACLVAVIGFHAREHEKNLLLQNERTVRQITESVSQGIRTIMLAGHPDIAEYFVQHLKQTKGVGEFRILRVDGREAYKDNETIERINGNLGEARFQPRADIWEVRAFAANDPLLRQVVVEGRFQRFYGSNERGNTITYLWPIRSEPACHSCHHDGQQIRGVMQLTASMRPIESAVREIWLQATIIAGIAVLTVVLAAYLLLRKSVIKPIERLSEAMQDVSGDLPGPAVSETGPEELRRTASGFNAMLRALSLSRKSYMQESEILLTLILSIREGVIATNDVGDVELVNLAAEEMIGRSAEEIEASGFDRLFDDPEVIARMLSHPATPQLLPWKGRQLAVTIAGITNDVGQNIGKVMHLRDLSGRTS